MQAADVKKVLPAYSIDVPAHEKGNLDEEEIVKKLRKVRYSASMSLARFMKDAAGWRSFVRWCMRIPPLFPLALDLVGITYCISIMRSGVCFHLGIIKSLFCLSYSAFVYHC